MIRAFCVALLRRIGWRMMYAPPPVAKAVVFVYPHTSNWDFPIGLLFRWPFGAIFRRLGGIPVNRRESTGFVAQMTGEFARHESFYLAIAPEGTRRYTGSLKSGFYRLALAARVPLALGFFDYVRREVGIAGYLELSGDESADLAQIAAAYADRRGRHPANQGRIAFGGKSTA